MCRWLSPWQWSRNKQRSIEMVSDYNLMVLLTWSQTTLKWSQTTFSQYCQSSLRLQSCSLVDPVLVSDCVEIVSDCSLMVLSIWSQTPISWSCRSGLRLHWTWSQTTVSQSCQFGLRLQSHSLVNLVSDSLVFFFYQTLQKKNMSITVLLLWIHLLYPILLFYNSLLIFHHHLLLNLFPRTNL